jgi:hypothetical protein
MSEVRHILAILAQTHARKFFSTQNSIVVFGKSLNYFAPERGLLKNDNDSDSTKEQAQKRHNKKKGQKVCGDLMFLAPSRNSTKDFYNTKRHFA